MYWHARASWLQDNLNTELGERDWGVQQVLTSANWGGVIGNFFTGGLNLQVSSAGAAGRHCVCGASTDDVSGL